MLGGNVSVLLGAFLSAVKGRVYLPTITFKKVLTGGEQ